MLLKRVVLRNIRCHEFYVFEPVLDGVTAICGVNGAGKSTVVNAFVWCLFGARGLPFKVRDLIREGVDPKSEVVGVECFVLHGGREYKVVRRVLSASGSCSCHVFSRDLSGGDFVEDCGPAPSHVERFLRDVFGFDEKGFYASGFVQQKQVDLIVSASARERGAIVEKLVGISAISEALRLAREESKGLQKALSVMRSGSVDDLRAQVAGQEAKVAGFRDRLSEVEACFGRVRGEYDVVEKAWGEESVRQEKLRGLREERSVLRNDLKNLEERLAEQAGVLESLKDGGVYSEDLRVSLEREFEDCNAGVVGLEVELGRLNDRFGELEVLFAEPVGEDVVVSYNGLLERKRVLEDKVRELEAGLSVCGNDVKNTRAFLRELDSGLAECPFCRVRIEDVGAERATHGELLKGLVERKRALSAELKRVKAESSGVLNELVGVQELLEKRALQVEAAGEWSGIGLEQSRLSARLGLERSRLRSVKERLDRVLLCKDRSDRVRSCEATVGLLNGRVRDCRAGLRECEDAIGSLGALPAGEFKALERRLRGLDREQSRLGLELARAEKDVEVAVAEAGALEGLLEESLRAEAEFERLSGRLTVLNESVRVLSGFREARVRSSVPVLSGIASEILRKFTDGEFVELFLNEGFEAFVRTASGVVRPVGVLSGGELSAAAIALRLAIALFLSEGGSGLLILDEVLVSMDESRQQLILETIAGLSGSQVVLIAHSQVANSFADRVVEI